MSAPLRVLFIGNSHTYYNDMPRMVQGLWREAFSRDIEVADSTAGGVGLEWHWQQRRDHDLVAKGWDHVVLQERSGGPTEAPASMRTHAGLFIDLVRQHGGRPLLYMTWAPREWPRKLDAIAAVYESIGQQHQVPVCPVGRAFAASLQARPDLALHDEDGSHASLAGSYLAACCLFRTISGAYLHGDRPNAFAPVGLALDDRAHLQAIADRSVAALALA